MLGAARARSVCVRSASRLVLLCAREMAKACVTTHTELRLANALVRRDAANSRLHPIPRRDRFLWATSHTTPLKVRAAPRNHHRRSGRCANRARAGQPQQPPFCVLDPSRRVRRPVAESVHRQFREFGAIADIKLRKEVRSRRRARRAARARADSDA